MNCFDIQLPFDFNPGEIATIVGEFYQSSALRMKTLDKGLVDPRLAYWLLGLGIGLRHVEVFYTPAGSQCPIHIDAPDGKAPHAKMNFAYGGPGSEMRWYEPYDSAGSRSAVTPTGTRSQILEQGGGRIISRAVIGRPSIINAGVYHDVINPSSEPRWCLSIVMQYKGGRLTWETAKKVFAFCTKPIIN